MKKTFVSLGAIVFVIGVILTIAGQSATKSQNNLKGAIAATSATTAPADTATTAPADTATTAPADSTTTADSETLTQKLDRFFAQDPNLASIPVADRTCAEQQLAGSMTTYELDNLLAADHGDSNYQLAVQGAKLTASGCHLQNTP